MSSSSSLKAQDRQQSDLTPWANSDSEDGLPVNYVHPRRWGRARKTWDTSLIMFLEFFTTMISTAGTPVAAHLHKDLGVGPVVATCMFVSTYLVGQTIGGVFFPPFSESFGRKKLYVVSTGLYSLACLLVGKVPTVAGIVVGRFVSGMLSSIPTTVATGSIEDLWDSRERVWWVFWWALLANLGILTGPVFGELISQHADWTWVFYTAAIVTACVTLLFLTIRESRPSVVLAHASDADGSSGSSSSPTAADKVSKWHLPTRHEKLDVVRPLRLLFTEPIVFLVAFISAVAFGLVYLFTEVLPLVYLRLGFSGGWQNAPFLALAVGMLLSILTRFHDRRVLARAAAAADADAGAGASASAGDAGAATIAPEAKFAGFLIGAPALAIGLWWFAWTIPPRVAGVHWAAPTLALVPVGYAVNEFDHVLAGYLSDCYETYTASSFAALALTRSLFCATFPLFGRAMFDALDFNVASSLFAALATVLCAVPPLLLRYGAWLRGRSAYANR
ncbi:Efflux pump vrtL [Colletotrichum orbiculare MAFF 240422]|uniref:Efflux pump vrtL n=1 Tax=Colletotrichum orbiculare (strain 104-T / ATCC 96160 / CBS 514.97 / LARS 414 / MAFF 240422) TaxID=1213857 RepID=N4VCJ3_COLOR|nr:Efflux pump vrtL [Colletotrichum orbiculare MAFF 240422]